jgi:predicted nuclease of predicted toxin-antitoxin system
VAVVSAITAGMGQSDDSLLDWASRERWVLVTGDLDFPRLIFAERRPPPLLLVVERRQPCDAERLVGDVLRVLRLGQRLHGHVIVFDGDDERVRAFPA